MCSERGYWLQLPESIPKSRGHNVLPPFPLSAGWDDNLMAGAEAATLGQETGSLVG